MKASRVSLVLLIALAMVTVARSGHELPVYPSYYPHEIQIETMPRERSAALLLDGRIQAYVGAAPHFTSSLPDHIRAIESIGSFIVVRVNPSPPLMKDERSACAVADVVVRAIAAKRDETIADLIVHPYPVTPLHGDYLHHVDLAEAANSRLLDNSVVSAAPSIGELKVKADGLANILKRPEWSVQGPQWDVEIAEVGIADLLRPSAAPLNGWLGPPWHRTGWFHAHLLLANTTGSSPAPHGTEADLHRLQADSFESTVQRINLERDFVAALLAGCHTVVAGYRMKREYINVEFSAGIENIAFDALGGLNSPMFIRTVKLKDFPWNGWLSLGIDGRASAAWNPIAGFTDQFGRLMWSAVGDPAVIPSPYDTDWMLNRISDVQSTPGPSRPLRP